LILDDINIDEATEYVYEALFGEKEKTAAPSPQKRNGQRLKNITNNRIAQRGAEVK